jgi:hypothetical protein
MTFNLFRVGTNTNIGHLNWPPKNDPGCIASYIILPGIVLYELQDPIVKLAIRDVEAGDTSKDLLIKLREAEGFLREAVTHLLYEPTHSPEGQLARIAMQD